MNLPPFVRMLASLVLKLIIAGFVVILCILLIGSISSLEHFNRVHENPLVVTATVVTHESYDNDGDTDYCSYVRYKVQDVLYENRPYEDVDTITELTPLGQTVQLEVSPEDPAEQISELKREGQLLFVFLPIFLALVSLGWKSVLRKQRSKENFSTPEPETIRKDALLTITSRFSLPFFLLMALGYGLCVWRYPAAAYDAMEYFAAGCAAIWLFCLFVAVRDCNIIRRDEYKLRRDILLRKDSRADDETASYYLIYRSEAQTWKTRVTKEEFDQAREGSSILSVYLPGKQKPVVHYTPLGNAK